MIMSCLTVLLSLMYMHEGARSAITANSKYELSFQLYPYVHLT